MALDLKSSSSLSPPRILIYGVHGVGKSSTAAGADKPVLLDIEDGFRQLDVPTFGVMRSWDELEAAMRQLLSEDHDFRTVILDTLDALEPLVWKKTCQDNKWSSIESPGFGKGYVAASDTWRYLLDGLDAIRDQRGMSIVLTAHAEVKRFDSPETDPYERFQPRLHARASALIQERMDAVLFAGYKVNVTKADVGFNKKVARGVGGGERLLYATERPAATAKNRYSMPEVMPLAWQSIATNIPYYKDTASNG